MWLTLWDKERERLLFFIIAQTKTKGVRSDVCLHPISSDSFSTFEASWNMQGRKWRIMESSGYETKKEIGAIDKGSL